MDRSEVVVTQDGRLGMGKVDRAGLLLQVEDRMPLIQWFKDVCQAVPSFAWIWNHVDHNGKYLSDQK